MGAWPRACLGGQLNDRESDCSLASYCGPSGWADWGVEGNKLDNPVHDLDTHGVAMGVENIYYPGAEDGLTVLVDNADVLGGPTPNGSLYINVRDLPTQVRHIEALRPIEVFIGADVDGASGGFAWIDERYDCAPEWDYDCQADLP